MKKYVFLILVFICNSSFAQDWCAWSFKFKLKINSSEIVRAKFKNIEVFLNDSYSYEMYQNSNIKLDSLTQEYTLIVNYGCISCGYSNNSQPPEIYLKINVEEDISKDARLYSTIIPVYFHKSQTWEYIYNLKDFSVDLGAIKIKHFLTDSFWKDSIETYEVIEVISPNSIKYRKKGEYTPRRMNKMIKVD